jgi:amino acid transporter
MLAAVALVALSYILPVGAMSLTKLSPAAWETGSWADIAGLLGGPALRIALVAGGMMSAFGMFNALVLSYSRLPYAMALDGMLPPTFAKLTRDSRMPWVSVVVLATAWALCLGLGFERLVTIDILIYGSSLLLEFVALAVLRFTRPDLPRAFKVPGGKTGAVLLGVCPMLLLGFSVYASESERILGMSGLAFGLILIVAGFLVYGVVRRGAR